MLKLQERIQRQLFIPQGISPTTKAWGIRRTQIMIIVNVKFPILSIIIILLLPRFIEIRDGNIGAVFQRFGKFGIDFFLAMPYSRIFQSEVSPYRHTLLRSEEHTS